MARKPALTIDIDTRQVVRMRQRLDDALRELSARGASQPVLEQIKTSVQAHITRMFKSGGRAGAHGRWASYQPQERAYAAVKRKLSGSAYPILGWRKGRSELVRSLTRDTHPMARTKILGDTLYLSSIHPAADGKDPLPDWARRRGHHRFPPIRRIWDPKPKDELELLDKALGVYYKMLADRID